MQGVYTITNTITGEQYVGQAKNVLRRWAQHEHTLSHHTHHSSRLSAAWEQYGPTAFSWTLLEVVTDGQTLRNVERGYIKNLRPAYNIRKVPPKYYRPTAEEARLSRLAHDDALKRQNCIWLLDAMVRYNHAREWFKRRITAGDIHQVPQPGTSKVYLDLADVERAVKREER